MRDKSTAEHLLEELAAEGPSPGPDDLIRHVYRPVTVSDPAGWPWPGIITAWWTDHRGITLCRLRLSGVPAPRWAVYDPDRITLLVKGGC
ncbi:hypothetical protein ACFYZE_21005 [Streptomyces sp. NPDC001796]|uniref:hypothetical protein n=1 Tax=Streptomyces sp. NPDC001796 TaxID=3364609 RepID=UPI0036CEA655